MSNRLLLDDRPTYCTRGCGRRLTAARRAQRHYVCNGCLTIRRGGQPAYHGRCLYQGCARPGRLRSGYCHMHYGNLQNRRERRDAVLARVLGEALPMEWLIPELERATPQAVEYARRFFEALLEGRVSITTHPYPVWRWKMADTP